MKITFPWFPKEVKPNTACHYMQKAKAKAIYREVCKQQTLESLEYQQNNKNYTHAHFTFYKPNNRHMDLDNCLSSCKSLVDGMADALEINDKCFNKITIEFAEKIGGYITVEIK